MTGDTSTPQSSGTSESLESDSFAQQLAILLQHLKPANQKETSQNISLSIKLNDFNYALWERMMRLAIGGRGCLSHITGSPPPPLPTDPEYSGWYQTDLNVLSWVIANMEPMLVPNYIHHRTARSIWASLESTYQTGGHALHIFELTVKANSLKQNGDPIEAYFSTLQRIWADIDQRQTLQLQCEADIALIQKKENEDRLYQFLAGIDESLDMDRREILRQVPLPTVTAAYATIRREITRQGSVLGSREATSKGVGVGLATCGRTPLGTKPKFVAGSQRAASI